jgi:hypothetical protein
MTGIITQEGGPMADQNEVINKFWNNLSNLLSDLTSLEVSTYVTFDGIEKPVMVKVNQQDVPCSLQAYTKLDLDADSTVVLPVTQTQGNLSLIRDFQAIHDSHVRLAIETRREMVKALLDAIPNITALR